MDTPLITAIIPTYQRPQLLKRAVRSVLNQTFPHFQILIADNASGPETDTVVDDLLHTDKRIQVLKQSTNLGICANFQTALMQVTTSYVCFLPDDDLYAPSFFADNLTAFQKHPDIAFSGGGGVLFFTEKNEVRCHIQAISQTAPKTGYYPQGSAVLAHLGAKTGLQLPAILFNTTRAKEVGGFDERLKFSIDADLTLKCAARFPVYVRNENPLYFYFLNSTSLTHAYDLMSQEKESYFLHENITSTPLMPLERQKIDQWFQKWQIRIYSKQYAFYYNDQRFDLASSYAKRIYEHTHSARWKSRQKRAALYVRFPLLRNLYSCLNSVEKSLRRVIKRKAETEIKPSDSNGNYQSHTDSAAWQEYILQLEGNEKTP